MTPPARRLAPPLSPSKLLLLVLFGILAPASAPEPCCLRVTPYHIQALAQRMAQRFQALEHRAQDLRVVFASFQAVHGNVSHRLRYLEAEHAQLSAIVSRLDSRVYSLEMDRRHGYSRHFGRDDFWRLRRLAEDKDPSQPPYVPQDLPPETTTVPEPPQTLPNDADIALAILPLEDPASLEELDSSSENRTDDQPLRVNISLELTTDADVNSTEDHSTTVQTPLNVSSESGCGPGGCDELSYDELQAALRDLDALLQSEDRRPENASVPEPPSAPDQENILLKRALKLALAALERTSETCLTFVNFTAGALEELTELAAEQA